MGKPQHDTPKQKERVRMRVKVRPRKTSLPLAHDDVYDNFGSNTVRQGVQEIVVYKDDVPKVMAKVETDHVLRERAHGAFWRKAVAATLETMRNVGLPVSPEKAAATMPVPSEVGISVNSWVMSQWPYDPTGRETRPGNAFFDWMTKHCEPEGRNPEAIFANMAGRGLLPLDFAEVIDGATIDPPMTEEQRNTVATGKALKDALGIGAPNQHAPDLASIAARLAALEAENQTLKAELGIGTKPAKGVK